MIEQSTVQIVLSTRHSFRGDINTLKCGSIMGCESAFGHEVGVVFSGPALRTCVPARNHQNSHSCGHIAHCTWDILLMKGSG